MQTTFKKSTGETFAPKFFAVFHQKGGKTFKTTHSEIDVADADDYENITKIELYKNGTENLAPVMVDQVTIKA